MAVYAITLAYRGSNFSGWQVQKNAPSIQAAVQNAVEKVFGTRLDVTGCSRTDSGVHALGYVCHIESEKLIDTEKLPLALNMHLPQDISAISARLEKADFHARYSALGKEYVYYIRNSRIRSPFDAGLSYQYPFELDVERLGELGRAYVGKHDFRAFMSAGSKITDTVRTVYYFNVCEDKGVVQITVGANGFLYNMVRIMVGTLLKAHGGSCDIKAALETKCRQSAGPTAPACGLYLNRVFYNEEELNHRIAEFNF